MTRSKGRFRVWYVYGTPKIAECGEDVTIDPLTGKPNKVVKQFSSVYEAAAFVDRHRPMQIWDKVAIYSKKEIFKDYVGK